MFENLYSITTLSELVPHLDEEVFLMLDIDHTLFEPVQTLGSVRWEKMLMDAYIAQGFSFKEADMKSFERWKEVQHITKVKTVEALTRELLLQAKEKVFHIFGLTARSNYLSKLTASQLVTLELEDLFTREVEDCELQLSHPASFVDGIIYCGHNQKGHALELFLKKNKLKPQKVICVDDQKNCLHEVSGTLQKLKIPFIGMHYLHCELKPYNPMIAAVQEKHFPILLTDEEALKLIP